MQTPRLAFDPLLDALRAAGEPTRLRLIALLRDGELTVGEIAEVLNQSQPRVSRHLKLLADAGLIERLPEGTWVFYRLAHGGGAGRLLESLFGLLPVNEARLEGDRQRLAVIRRRRAKQAADYFSANAKSWDKLGALHIDEVEIERMLLDLLGKAEIPDLLDIGTGTGRVLTLLGPKVGRGVGVDNSSAMLAIARAKLAEAGLRNCHVRHGDMYDLPWQGQSFDAVTIHQVLHFAERPAAIVAEAARVLRPEGPAGHRRFRPAWGGGASHRTCPSPPGLRRSRYSGLDGGGGARARPRPSSQRQDADGIHLGCAALGRSPAPGGTWPCGPPLGSIRKPA